MTPHPSGGVGGALLPDADSELQPAGAPPGEDGADGQRHGDAS